jgi:hypothetical protein
MRYFSATARNFVNIIPNSSMAVLVGELTRKRPKKQKKNEKNTKRKKKKNNRKKIGKRTKIKRRRKEEKEDGKILFRNST